MYLVDDADAAFAAGVPGARTKARSARAGGRRVGELDEEMVYEAREGEVILLGASAWRIEQITHDRVLVSPAPGQPGKIPFWKGDGPGRPIELGRSLGEFTRTISEEASDGTRGRKRAEKTLREDHKLDQLAASNLIDYLAEEQSVTGALPTDQTIVLERFRDELGDWRICLLTPFGARVHAPWALAIEARLRERLGLDVQPIWSDDGIVIRLPMTDELGGEGLAGNGVGGDPGVVGGGAVAAAEEAVRIASEDVEELVIDALGGSALFSSRFRENAGRALLLPRRRAGTAHTAVADAPAVRAAVGRGQQVRVLPDHPRDVPRVPPGRLRPARAERHPVGDRAARDPAGERRDSPGVAVRELLDVRLHRLVHVRGRRTRWPTGGRRRSPSIAICCASCSAPRSCASCSTAMRLPSLSWSSSS